MIDHQNTIIVIPARMATPGLPGKLMADVNGSPLLLHVVRRAQATGLGRVLVAAAESEIANAVRAAGGDAIVTAARHVSGIDIAAEALSLRDQKQQYSHVLLLQADLWTVDATALQRCLAGLTNDQVDASTIACPLSSPGALTDNTIVKALAPLGEQREVAFARDFVRDASGTLSAPASRHIGVCAYRRSCVERLAGISASARERHLGIDVLRALDNGVKVAVVRIEKAYAGVDTAAELEHARSQMKDRT